MTNINELTLTNSKAVPPSISDNPVNEQMGRALETVNSIDHSTSWIDVTADAMHRIYTGTYMIFQSHKDRLELPETPMLMQSLIHTLVADNIAQTYPQFENFNVTVSVDDNDNLVMNGENAFTNTVLHAMNQLMNTPVQDGPCETLQALSAIDAYDGSSISDDSGWEE